MNILAIETSCDETACAITEDGTKIVSSVVASSTEMHKKYGGIVPEIAAREQLKCILPVLEESLAHFVHPSSHAPARQVSSNQHNPFTAPRKPHKSTSLHSNRLFSDEVWLREIIEKNIDAIAVTVGPGLIGSLLVGVETAKTIAFVTGKPIIPVNHVLAHMYANFVPSAPEGQNSLRAKSRSNLINFPAISLVVSGGHTELYLMTSMKDLMWLGGTLDDAAGECFDKSARLLGFGSGGGAAVEAAASRHSGKRSGLAGERVQNPTGMLDKTSMTLPRPMIGDKSLNFSFSGLKTAIVRELKKVNPHVMLNSCLPAGMAFQHPNEIPKPASTQRGEHVRDDEQLVHAFSFEIQEAITDVLVEKTVRAAKQYSAKSILLSGGVAANTRLREKFQSAVSPPAGETGVTIRVPEVRLCTDNAVAIASYAYFRGSPTDWHEITAIPDLSVVIS